MAVFSLVARSFTVKGKRVFVRMSVCVCVCVCVLTAVHCSLVPDTVGASPPEGIKPRGVIHWVSASHGRPATVNLYDRLFSDETPDAGDKDFMEYLNPASLQVMKNCWVEPGLEAAAPEQAFQFERSGYFVADRHAHSSDNPVFNRIIGLKDSSGR